jgi:hypothetical protein
MRYYSSTAQAMSLVGSIDAAATTITVNITAGLPASTPFTLVLDYGSTAEEVVTVTAVAGPSLTVLRGEDGSAAQSHTPGALVRHAATARDLREPQQHMAAGTGVHGLAAGDSVVGAAALDAEAIARANGDAANANLVAAEATARGNAVSAEATARSNADALLVPKTTTVNGHALSGNVVVTLADMGVTWGDTLPGTVTNGAVFIKLV